MVEVESKEKNSKMKSKKRTLKSPKETVRPSKSARVFIPMEVEVVDEIEPEQREVPQESEEGCPWRNLELILLLQNKEIDEQKFVSSHFIFAYMLGLNSFVLLGTIVSFYLMIFDIWMQEGQSSVQLSKLKVERD